jgi:hypothetical protein
MFKKFLWSYTIRLICYLVKKNWIEEKIKKRELNLINQVKELMKITMALNVVCKVISQMNHGLDFTKFKLSKIRTN